jgi:DNA-binding response OmpR family regulator
MESLTSSSEPKRRPRALLADPDPYFRPYAAAALRQSGFDVQELREANLLVQTIARSRVAPDVIVVHAGLACGDALHAVRRVRRLAPELPILMVADARAVGALRDGLALGASEVLPRPQKVVDVASAARGLVRSRSQTSRA